MGELKRRPAKGRYATFTKNQTVCRKKLEGAASG